jgi:hypothetical protein
LLAVGVIFLMEKQVGAAKNKFIITRLAVYEWWVGVYVRVEVVVMPIVMPFEIALKSVGAVDERVVMGCEVLTCIVIVNCFVTVVIADDKIVANV